jgi:hypothetical protein
MFDLYNHLRVPQRLKISRSGAKFGRRVARSPEVTAAVTREGV